MADNFENFSSGLTSPATKHFAIVPNDSADLPTRPRVIYCHAAGNIVILDEDGVSLTYTMAAGDRLDFRGVRVMASGTTGTYYGWS